MTQTRKMPDTHHPNNDAGLDDQVGQSFKTPSWFIQEPAEQVQELSREISERDQPTQQPYFETPNTQAYEAYRRRMEQRFKEGQDIYDRPQETPSPNLNGPQNRRPTLPMNEIQGRKRLYELEQHSQPHARSKSTLAWGRIVLLGTAAACVGALTGLGFSNIDLIKQKYQVSLSALQDEFVSISQPGTALPQLAAVSSLPHETIIIKKTVATATLDVADVKGSFGSMIPLLLSAQSSDYAEPFTLKISGLPDQAYLTAGVKSTQGSWSLKPTELNDLKLFVPQADVKQFDMEVAAVEDRTGELAAPIKAMNVQLQASTVVDEAPTTQVGTGKTNSEGLPSPIAPPVLVYPVNAAPDTAQIKLGQPSAIPAATSDAADFVSKGNALLQSGDIISARQFFLRASELGNAQGSFGVARSYDPKVFAQLNVVGLQPDAVQAADWYQKAAQAGVVAAGQ